MEIQPMEYFKVTFRNKGGIVPGMHSQIFQNREFKRSLMIYRKFYYLVINNNTPPIEFEIVQTYHYCQKQAFLL